MRAHALGFCHYWVCNLLLVPACPGWSELVLRLTRSKEGSIHGIGAGAWRILVRAAACEQCEIRCSSTGLDLEPRCFSAVSIFSFPIRSEQYLCDFSNSVQISDGLLPHGRAFLERV